MSPSEGRMGAVSINPKGNRRCWFSIIFLFWTKLFSYRLFTCSIIK